ncbi:hypothetical protein [Allorhizobium undicola]|uniref:hypothetical protein n=1 Tax=Allorhizobium undicola TaxID=78527 RepID=UPI0012B6211E|nr:hypothetical protein [Allorhizobium undicola]
MLGMHRSGTSALTRFLSLLGCATPGTLMPESEFNVTGYWESPLIARLNDRVLKLATANWQEWRRLDSASFDTSLIAGLMCEAAELLVQEFDDASLILLKDPRLCIVLPFWRQTFEVNSIAPHCVLTLRNPLEVAASLARRNGFGALKSLLLWLRYTLDAERFSRGLPRVFTSYDEVLQNYERLPDYFGQALGLAWPRSPEQALKDAAAFLSRDHRHHDMTDAKSVPPYLAPWITEVYDTLSRWARDGEDEQGRLALDRVYGSFAEIEQPIGPVFQELDAKSREMSGALRKIGELKEREREKADALTALETEIADLKMQLQHEKELHAQTRALVAESERSAEALTQALKQSETDMTDRFKELARLTSELIRVSRSNQHFRDQFTIMYSAMENAVQGTLAFIDGLPLPSPLRDRIGIRLARMAGLVDVSWYLENNQDVRAAGGDPVEHFIRFGRREGRAGRADFNSLLG